MKRKFLLGLSLLIAALPLSAQLRKTNAVAYTWDDAAWPADTEFHIYSTASLKLTPIVWTHYTNITLSAFASNGNQIRIFCTGEVMFFAATASNILGESVFSNATNAPLMVPSLVAGRFQIYNAP